MPCGEPSTRPRRLRRGPTFISFTANSLDDEGSVDIIPSSRTFSRVRPDAEAIERAVEILAGASNPVMLIGDSVGESGAVDEAVRVAEILGCRVYSTMYSLVNFPTSHPQYLGPIRLGFRGTRDTLSTTDAVLAAGKIASNYYMFSDPPMRYLSEGTRLVHVHWDASNVGQTEPTDVGIAADPRSSLGEIADALDAAMSGSARAAARARAAEAASEKRAAQDRAETRLKSRWDGSPMSPERMMAELAKGLPDDAIIANDAVTSAPALNHSMEFDEPGSFYGGRGGALGWGMGGTLGLKLANPDRPVVGVLGDGSAMMTAQGLWTAAAENIPVVYVICNNGIYKVLKVNMNAYKELILKGESPPSRFIGMDFSIPFDMAGMANAFGVHGRRIEDPEELAPALREAVDMGKPALLDVIIDPAM